MFIGGRLTAGFPSANELIRFSVSLTPLAVATTTQLGVKLQTFDDLPPFVDLSANEAAEECGNNVAL